MNKVFDQSFVGLKIVWKEFPETEYLGPAVLSGISSQTAASCKFGKGYLHYLYPVEINDESPTRRTITYKQNPARWPRKWGWEIYKGKLIIDFKDAHSRTPTCVSYWYRDDNTTEQLEPNKDWVYIPSRPASTERVIPRGRLQTSRLARPYQQALRNLLLSEHGRCQITGTECPATLEACHIVPVKNGGNDTVDNTLLLRRDLHALFDSGLLRFRLVSDSWVIDLDSSITDPNYQELRNKPLTKRLSSSHQYLKAREKLEDAG